MSGAPHAKPAHLFETLGEGASITEGSATIAFPKGQVFYNPVQQFNRDLSITAIACYAEQYLASRGARAPPGITILEALSATGLRSIRYAKEIPRVERVFANDMDPAAVALIQDNIRSNGAERVEACLGDAVATMHRLRSEGKSIHVVDLDPYGSAAPFIDAAVQTVADGGLLCVTCTDLAVLCSTYPETCFAKYGGLPLRGDGCHEAALRLILQTIETSANRYKRHIVPLMSCSIDFYARIFVRIVESPAAVKRSVTLRGPVPRCVQCKSIFPRPFGAAEPSRGAGKEPHYVFNHDACLARCPLCDSRIEICGPMWLGPLHDRDFVQRILQINSAADKAVVGTTERIEGFASVISEELDFVPLSVSLPDLARFFKTSVIPAIAFRSALLNAGHRVSGSHCGPQSIKTNAPLDFVWRVMIRWIEAKELPQLDGVGDPVHLRMVTRYAPGGLDSPQGRMLARIYDLDTLADVSFERHADANPPSRASGLKRFPENPTRHWGPLARAKQRKASD